MDKWERILLSLNNFLLISLSILLGLLLFSIMKNQHHNDYIIDLNKRAPVIASQFKKLTPGTAKRLLLFHILLERRKNFRF